MSETYICQREECGHNKSAHTYEWNKWQGRYDTFCRIDEFGVGGRHRCRCSEFLTEEAATTAKAVAAAGPGREGMICPHPCGHHVDEHYWSPSGQIQGVCHVSTHGDYPTCGCPEYAGPEESEMADAR